MTFGRLHVLARRHRRRMALLAVMLCLGGAVVVAHSALGIDHMGDGDAMCLAVLSLGGAALALVTSTAATLVRAPRAPLQTPLPVCVPAPAPLVRMRAGPDLLQVFLR